MFIYVHIFFFLESIGISETPPDMYIGVYLFTGNLYKIVSPNSNLHKLAIDPS